jgi:hypothetical protein
MADAEMRLAQVIVAGQVELTPDPQEITLRGVPKNNGGSGT